LQQYGWRERYISNIPGGNSRLDELQAAILSVKLKYLEQDNMQRKSLALIYNELLSDIGLTLPEIRSGVTHVYHQYVVRLPQRDALRSYLRQAGIGTIIHYAVPIHLRPAYRDRLPLVTPLRWTEEVARQILSLPMFPQLHDDQMRHVGESIWHFFSKQVAKS
jgi:dTDP-4-amino-4,6-dideoxygalactose transaminase